MTDNIHTQRQWYEISQVQFGFLYPNEVRKISVCQVQNPSVYDKNTKLPNKNGLYDPAMGVAPNDKDSVCPTCGHVGLQCSGHPGHIELILQTYNPLIIDTLMKLLKMNCFDCHRFRIKPKIKQDYRIILLLLKKDKIKEAYDFYQINADQEKKKLEKLQKQSQNQRQKQQYKQKVEYCKKKIEIVQKIKKQYIQLAQKESQALEDTSSASIQLFTQFTKYFNGLCQNKCPYCKKQNKIVKKEGANKIFVITRQSQRKKDVENQKFRKKSRDSISRGQSTMYNTDTNQNNDKGNRQKYITPRQVYNELKQLWRNQNPLLSIIFGNSLTSNNFQMFFVKTIFVPPSRFRPQSKLGQQKYLHDHTNMLEKILKNNIDLKTMMIQQYLQQICSKQGQKGKRRKQNQLKAIKNLDFTQTSWFSKVLKKFKHKNQFINKWLELQDTVNCFIDSAKSSKIADKDSKGIRQILQRKEGLFRMKMMGKRVNYAARSVISPDPSLNTNQVGVPLFMAKKLTFPQHINQYNLEKLQNLVINGSKFPGANFLQQNGKIVKLDCLTEQQRVSHARNLWNNHENKILYRHINTGDNVLFNRQPTLHKAGLMTHKVKVLPKQSTLRMNYANCKSYNADFDGDQMNMHAIQTYMGKAQAQLTVSDQMFASPMNGKPLREIMQDAIIAAVYMTFKDTFFEKKDFSELIYQSTFSLLQNKPANTRLFLVKPAILKPKQLWTGKQLVTNVIKLVVEFSDLKFKDSLGLSMKSQTKIAKSYMEGYEQESQVLVWNNQLLKGLIDKSQVGSGSDYGLLHSFNELYGQRTTGKLMTCLTKLFLTYIQMHGFTCGLDDLLLRKKSNKNRRQAIQQIHQYTVSKVCEEYGASHPQHVNYFGRSQYKCDQNGKYLKEIAQIHLNKDQQIVKFLQHKFTTDLNAGDQLDAQYKHHLHQKSSDVIQDCLKGFMKKFPQNNFSMMTVTGAKGSNVNHSQVSVMLGQQQLEGRRVPMMITGKTLPSFIAYDPNPRASGFISDRFLTGLRYQQFYFHCMAGRQGLIDTAVKTSRSGYLQRCLMKHLQSLKVEYDYTVRDSDGGIVQFLYGQDSLNPMKQKFFNKMEFLTKNLSLLKEKFKYKQFKNDLKWKQIEQFKMTKSGRNRTIHQKFHPGKNLGSISQKCYTMLQNHKTSREFNQVYSLKYKFNMIQPGQAVGCTAAQSIGQPSTQMTLNTFHLAGHGGVNLTLGIPRLRQLLMTSSDKIKTPIMELNFKEQVSKQQALNYARKMNRVKLSQLIKFIDVEQWKELMSNNKSLLSHQQRKRYYRIRIQYQNQEFIKRQFELAYGDIQRKIKQSVISNLLNYINRVKKKNELRAQIKRVTVTQKQKQQNDQNQDQEENNEKEFQQKDKIIEQFIQNMKDEKQPNQVNQIQDQNKQKNYKSPQFDSLIFTQKGCEIIVKVSLNLKKFLMTKVVQKILKDTLMKEFPGIKSAIVLERKGGIPFIQTQGVNFGIIQKFKLIDKQSVSTNDIQAMSKKFGIQAARNILVKQIVTLFGAYGVSVDYRHLYLIGDYVTFGGNIKAMNRNWMKYNASPFLRMTFQTSVKFITDAALRCQTDKCKTPSSKIILGQPPLIGTGICDILMDTHL